MTAISDDSDDDEHDKGLTPDTVKRHHTDCICCLVFVAAVVGLVSVFSYGLQHGDPQKYMGLPTARGEICGVDESVKDKPYLFFCKDGGIPSYKKAVCVAGCGDNDCPGSASVMPEYTAEPFAGVLCLPDAQTRKELAGMVMSNVTSNQNVKLLLEVKNVFNAWPVLVGSAGAAVVAGFLYLFLLEHFTSCFVWLGFAILILASGAVGGGLVYVSQQPGGLDGVPSTGDSQKDLIVGAVCLAITALFMCIACCKRTSVDRAIDCIKSAAECVKDNPSLLLEPLFTLVFKISTLAVMVYGLVYLLACAESVTSSVTEGIQVKYTNAEYGMIGFYVFMMIWVMELFSAVSSFVIAYVTQLWFFKTDRICSLMRGYTAALYYHLGTLAYGSFIIAVVRGVRIVLSVVSEASKDTGNPVVHCLTCCCNCLAECFERFLKKLNKFAYMDTAINSNGFCTAAGHALSVLTHNATAAFTLHGATFLFEIAGCGSITAAGAAATYLSSTKMEKFNDPGKETYVEDPAFLAVVAAFFCFLVSVPFMHVFANAADTVLFCFALERQRTPMLEESKGFISRQLRACWVSSPSSKKRAPYNDSRHPPGTKSLLEKVSK